MKKELNADGSQMPLMQLTLLTGFIGGVFGCSIWLSRSYFPFYND